VRKLTVDLIETYKNINKVYYIKKKQRLEEEKQQREKEKSNQYGGFDDEHGDYKIVAEETINRRYVVKERVHFMLTLHL
jgi:hypothetical protein